MARLVRLYVLLALSAGIVSSLLLTGCSSKSSSSTTPATVSVSLAPTTATLAAGQTQNFTATVTNDGTATPGVTWTASVGAITAAGIYTAPTPIATTSATITATSKTDPTKSATASVTLTPIAVSVSPMTATLSANGTQTFTATVTGDSTLNQGVTWSATAGTISAAGLYTAPSTIASNTTATVTATSKTDTTKAGTATVTLQAPVALSVSTTSLPAAITSVAYSQALSATGGTSPYTWTVTTGALPSGLSLSTAGVISGTPTVAVTATVNFTVTVTDNVSGTATKALALVAGPALASGTNNSELSGTYAFLVQGMYNGNTNTSTGKVFGETILGSITANGAGSITTGSIDNYDSKFNASSTSVTGNYSIGADHRGMLIINSGTRSFTFAVATAGISGGIANRLKLVQFEDNNSTVPNKAVATGFGKLQNASAFIQLNGTYVLGMSGETACTGCASATVAPFGSVAMAGYFTAGNGTITGGTADAHAFSANYNGLTLGGSTVAPVSGTGRGTLTLSVTGTIFPTMPAHFVYYIISANELLIASTDTHNASSNASGMLSGTMQLQTINSYGANTLGGGNTIAYESYASGGNGTNTYSQYSAANVLEVQLTAGSNAFSALVDTNDGNNATPALNQNFTGLMYTLTTGGRLTVSGAGPNSPIFYYSAPGKGYGLDQSTGNDGALYILSSQSGAPFSGSTFTGLNAAIVTAPPAAVSQGSFTGIATFSSGGNISLTQDYAQAGSLTSGATGTASFIFDPTTGTTTGRGTASNSIFYAVSANKSIVMDSTATGAPNITIIENNLTTTLPF